MKRIIISLSFLVIAAVSLCAQGQSNVRSLTLQECIDRASSENVAVRNSHLDLLSAKMQKREVFANYFPTVNASAVGFQALNPLVRIGLNDLLGSSDAANNIKYNLSTEAALAGISTTYETLYNAFSAGLTLTQPIYAGGRIANGNRLAALGVEAATLQESIAKRDAACSIEAKYWQAVSLEEKLSVINEAISLSDSLLKDAKAAYSAGLLTDSESDKVMMKRHELLSLRIRLKGGILLSRMDLCEAVGINVSEASTLRLSDRLPEIAPDISQFWKDPSAAVDGLDENRLLDMAVNQKKLEKNMAMGEALPQIGIGASYGYGRVIGTAQMNGALFATVKIPITDWSKSASKMRRLEYQKEKAENDKEHYSTMLEMKLRKLWIELESCNEELSLKQEMTAYADKALKRSEADCAAGIVTLSEVMEKQVALSKAKCEQVDAMIAFKNALSEYKSAVYSEKM